MLDKFYKASVAYYKTYNIGRFPKTSNDFRTLDQRKDGFVWWVGVVEERADPLGLGRCRIRIFGWHTDNDSYLPKDELPWAQPMYPVNNSKTISPPKVGDWIVGFFMDGMSGQAPIMMGVLPGMQKD